MFIICIAHIIIDVDRAVLIALRCTDRSMKLEFIRPTDRPTDLGLMILLVLLGIPVAIIASICLLIYFTRHTNKHLVAFFHPYCAAGGGGERVLWTGLAGRC